jgi:glucose-1-phosphate adenylyltransferase
MQVMGSDLTMSSSAFAAKGGLPPIGVGCGTHLRRVIVDKNARIGRNCRILNEGSVQEGGSEEQGWVIRSGLVVLLKDCVIPDNTVI